MGPPEIANIFNQKARGLVGQKQLTTHDVTWSKWDRRCSDQYAALIQPEKSPTMPVRAEIVRLPGPEPSLSFERFNFDKEVGLDE